MLSLRYRPLQKVSYPRLGLLLTMVPIPVQAKSRSINLIRSSLRHLNLLGGCGIRMRVAELYGFWWLWLRLGSRRAGFGVAEVTQWSEKA